MLSLTRLDGVGGYNRRIHKKERAFLHERIDHRCGYAAIL